MATIERLEAALVNADKAGDMDAARKFAAAIREYRAAPDVAGEAFGDLGPATQSAPEVPTTIGQDIQGAGETALALGTGIVGGTAGMVGGTVKGLAEQILSGNFGTQEAADMVERAAMQGAESLTYAPRTQAGQQQTAAVGQALAPLMALGPAGMPLAGAEMALAGGLARQAAPQAMAAANIARGAVGEGVQSARQRLQSVIGHEQAAPSYGESASAGSAAVPLQNIRQTTAEGLPVPIDLTLGELTRKEDQLAFEFDIAKDPLGEGIRARRRENRLKTVQNFDALREKTGAETVGQTELGTNLVAVLNKGWEAAKNKTRAEFKKADMSEEANAQVDLEAPVSIGEGDQAITDSLIGYLNKQPTKLKSSNVTDDARNTLVQLGLAAEVDGKLAPLPATVRQLREARSEIAGSAPFGDGKGLRKETILKKMIDDHINQVAGPLYKKANATRVEQAQKFENRAIVANLLKNKKNSTDRVVPMEKVFARTVLGGTTEELEFLKKLIQSHGRNGKQVWKDLQGEYVNYLRDETTKRNGSDRANNLLISSARMNELVKKMDKTGKLETILGHKNAQITRDLNEVLGWINTVPPETIINHSGTTKTLMLAMAETGLLSSVLGFGAPVLTGLKVAKSHIRDVKIKKRVDDALRRATPQGNN